MPEQEFGPIVSRLEMVERTLQQLTSRVYTLEHAAPGFVAQQSTTVIPPPIVPIATPARTSQPTAPVSASRIDQSGQPYDFSLPEWNRSKWKSTSTDLSTDPGKAKQVDDLEYKIGLIGLLRCGAAVIVIAIIYLVGLAISKGYITPTVQFAGEIVLCLGFIGLGFAKRNEREEFGQLMVGVGSCGLYLSFAGGHLFKHLYSGEALVALFVALSFANLGIAFWRSSRSFLAIGMIGGLTAAMLPMRQYRPTLDIELQFLILVPTALIIIRNRWTEMAIVLWVASTAALIPALTYDSDWTVRLVGLYGTSLLCSATYALVWSENSFDPWCLLSVTMIAAAGVIALGFDNVKHGSLHVLILAGIGMIIGLAFRQKAKVQSALLLGSLAVALTLSPVGFDRLHAGSAFAITSVILALCSLKFVGKALSALAGLQLGLGLCAYTAPWMQTGIQFSVVNETWLLTALMASTVACCYAFHKSGAVSETMMLVGSFLALPMFCRMGFIWLTSTGFGWMPSLAILVPLTVFTIGLLAVGKLSNWSSTLVFAWVVLVIAMVQYAQVISDGFHNPFFDSVLVLSLMGAVVFAGTASRMAAGSNRFENLIAGSGALVAVLLVRLMVIWLTLPSLRLNMPSAVISGLLAVTALSGYFAIQWKWAGLIPQGWVTILGASIGVLSLQSIVRTPVPTEVTLVVVAILGVLLMARCTSLASKERAVLTSVSTVTIWILFSQLSFDLLSSRVIGLKTAPALTLAWIVLAIALIALGFICKARYLRFWSFGVFASALVKIFLYDLADLDPGVRVILLMVLGMGMVGAGYWYIRTQTGVGEDATAGVDPSSRR